MAIVRAVRMQLEQVDVLAASLVTILEVWCGVEAAALVESS